MHVFDFGRVDENYYIAMNLLMELTRLPQLRGTKPQQTIPVGAAYIMKMVFEGMAYAHDKKDHTGKVAGVVHRDISPHNILPLRRASENQ